jgi:hypothetical protein
VYLAALGIVQSGLTLLSFAQSFFFVCTKKDEKINRRDEEMIKNKNASYQYDN